MLDRAKFWRIAASRGVGQLYNLAGWVGLLVLVLGVAAGIAVPLVFKLSPWLTAVVLLGLLFTVLLEGTYRVWHATDQQRAATVVDRDTARNEIERRFENMRYALQISDLIVNLITGPSTMEVQIGLKITNSSDEYLRYEIEDVSTVIGDRRSLPGPILNTITVVPPHGTDIFMPPAAPSVPLNWQMGSLSLTVRYGHASGPLRYRLMREYAVQAMRQPGLPESQVSTVNLVPVNAPEIEDI